MHLHIAYIEREGKVQWQRHTNAWIANCKTATVEWVMIWGTGDIVDTNIQQHSYTRKTYHRTRVESLSLHLLYIFGQNNMRTA